MITVTKHVCQRCGIEFMRESSRAYKYCSLTCLARRPSKLDIWSLARAAKQGLPMTQICADLDASHTTVRRALRAAGLYRTWTHSRFSKCASPRVGPTSAATVSGATISQSAVSA